MKYSVTIVQYKTRFEKRKTKIKPRYKVKKKRINGKLVECRDEKGNLIYLKNKDGSLKVANKKSITNPYDSWTPNAQAWYSGTMHPQTRAKLMQKMHSYYANYLQDAPIFDSPIALKITMYDNMVGADIDNTAYPYFKCILDTLVSLGKIPEDNRKIVKSITFIIEQMMSTPSIKIEIDEY